VTTGLTVVATVLSVMASAVTILLFLQYMRDRGRLTWRVVEACVKKVLAEMNEVDYKPDLVVGVGRGGAVVGGMLAGNLGHVVAAVIVTLAMVVAGIAAGASIGLLLSLSVAAYAALLVFALARTLLLGVRRRHTPLMGLSRRHRKGR
jgi:hypothetical protein